MTNKRLGLYECAYVIRALWYFWKAIGFHDTHEVICRARIFIAQLLTTRMKRATSERAVEVADMLAAVERRLGKVSHSRLNS